MSEQNRLIKELISMQKLKHTSLQKFPSTNIKQELLEINDDDKQSEALQHLIDRPELFHDPYSFEIFEMNQLSGLQKESLNFETMTSHWPIISLNIETYLKELSQESN